MDLVWQWQDASGCKKLIYRVLVLLVRNKGMFQQYPYGATEVVGPCCKVLWAWLLPMDFVIDL